MTADRDAGEQARRWIDDLRIGRMSPCFHGSRQSMTAQPSSARTAHRTSLRSYALAAFVVCVSTVVARLARPHLELADIVMIYLVGIIFVSTRVEYVPSLIAASLSVLSLDFFCVPPYLSFAVTDLEHVPTFAVMLLVAVVMTTLTNGVRAHALAATDRERRTAALYALSRDLTSMRDRSRLAPVVVQHMRTVFDANVAIFLPAEGGRLGRAWPADAESPHDDGELDVANWAYSHMEPASSGTAAHSTSQALYLPLVASGEAVGVVRLVRAPGEPIVGDERTLLDAFVTQIALAVESTVRAGEAERARLEVESEKLRNTLFSSVSHDLRTPLAAITGAAGVLRDDRTELSTTQAELVDTVYVQAERLGRLLTNLLEMARLESGALRLRREWQPIEEVIGSALHRVEDKIVGRPVTAEVPRDLPLANVDAALMEVALLNVLENAIKYTPEGSPIDITARCEGDHALTIDIADRGPGVPPGEEERIFRQVSSRRLHERPGLRSGPDDLPRHRRGARRPGQGHESS